MSLLNTFNDPFFNTGFGSTGFGNTGFGTSAFPGFGNTGLSTYGSMYPSRRRLASTLPTTGGAFGSAGYVWSMDVDVMDTDKEYIVLCEIPGVPKEKLNVSVENNLLIIRCEKIQMELPVNFSYDISEISYGMDTRRIRLPANVNQDSVKTCLKDGLLCIKFEKSEAHGPKKLEIQA